jgi:hypothetical protein
MKVNLHNLRERAIDAFFDASDSKPMRFVVAKTRPLCLGLTLLMAAFYFGFVARAAQPGSTALGIVFGTLFVALAVFECWLMYREKHPRLNSLKGEPPFPIPPCPSRFGSPALATLRPGPNWPRPQGLPRETAGTSKLELPPLPGPAPLGNIEPSPDWPERH